MFLFLLLYSTLCGDRIVHNLHALFVGELLNLLVNSLWKAVVLSLEGDIRTVATVKQLHVWVFIEGLDMSLNLLPPLLLNKVNGCFKVDDERV